LQFCQDCRFFTVLKRTYLPPVAQTFLYVLGKGLYGGCGGINGQIQTGPFGGTESKPVPAVSAGKTIPFGEIQAETPGGRIKGIRGESGSNQKGYP
jgi:hypothetical protein